ncbi:zinc finger and SCAN domain-containing protein 22-like isoform X3 [Thrips palmi]|uniref:Zinc finger and SCAN domain-containing protein 22-like isoform X3 n=1 Tax=Thrips palmi TaxID=161013 RepID=A0A6P8Y5W4_THRPL|nr:zinc finger and SCAN domain-containing protein 22-like isoform X3 [Thrips palmi]
MVMDQRRDGVELLGDSAQYGLKHMLPECFVSVKLETYEEGSCSDLQQYPVAQSTSPENSSRTGFISGRVAPPTEDSSCSQPSSTSGVLNASSKQLCLPPSSSHIIYQVPAPTAIMQQAGGQSQAAQASSQAAQIAHAAEAAHVSQSGGRVPQAPGAPPHFAHSHARASEIAWLSHAYVDQGAQHFHPHQMPYLPNDATLLSSIPPTQEGTRLAKQSGESQPGPQTVSCRAENNPPPVGGVAPGDSADSNAFISYVLNPQRGVSAAGIFLFDASRGLPSQSPHQIQPGNEAGSRTNDTHNGRSVEESIRDNSSDSTSTSESPKPGDTHLVSRSSQTIVTMSQIQDNPILPDAKIIVNDASAPEIAEQEDNKDRVFADADGKTYASQQALVNHDRYHRGERPYECETCHKAFATNSHLVTHRRTHTGERPFQCQLCQRCFADRSAFVKHERTHGPNGAIVKRYKCDECGSGFVDSCGLKKHIRIHTGERPYVCNVCEKTFSTSSTFVAHKRIHTGERPYKCESCDKMFITKSHLLTHRRTHTGEKPFTCTVCNRCFADGSSFRRHERLHTGENRHICMQCGRGFPLESSLEKHKQTHVQSGSFSYVYENRNDLNCLSSQQPQSCDVQGNRSGRISLPQVRDNSDRNSGVDLSREITDEVNRNNLCAVASREIDCENQSSHSTIMVSAREIA